MSINVLATVFRILQAEMIDSKFWCVLIENALSRNFRTHRIIAKAVADVDKCSGDCIQNFTSRNDRLKILVCPDRERFIEKFQNASDNSKSTLQMLINVLATVFRILQAEMIDSKFWCVLIEKALLRNFRTHRIIAKAEIDVAKYSGDSICILQTTMIDNGVS